MSENDTYSGIWLHEGEQRGRDFRHSAPEYHHGSSPQEAAGGMRMRHSYVEQEGRRTGVWAPEHWTDEEITAALETNW